MMLRRICFLIVLLLSVIPVYCQQSYGWQDFVNEYFCDDDDQSSVEEQYETLYELYQSPIPLHSITKEQLEVLPFLSPKQIEDIVEYVYINGSVRTFGELWLIPSIDERVFRYLRLFFKTVDKRSEAQHTPRLSSMIKYGKGEFVSRLDVPLSKKDGYKDYPDSILIKSPNKVYQGASFYKSERFLFHYTNRLYFGLTMEKDAGEPFFSKSNKGYDSYSAYLYLRNLGKFRTFAVGNYKMNVGMGLILNSGYSLGKSMISSAPINSQTLVRRHSSTSEYNYFTGIAATYNLSPVLDVTGFVSRRTIDANLTKDSLLITSLKTDGYHRTELEISKKGNTRNSLIGANLLYHKSRYQFGFTYINDSYQHVFISHSEGYRKYYPAGNNFWNLGTNYQYRSGSVTVAGETAFSGSGGVATLNSASMEVGHYYNLNVIHRFYSYRYNALHSSAFSEGGHVKNESGLYVGIQGSPLAKMEIKAYVDYFYFPWKKYLVSDSSDGVDFMGQTVYKFSPHLNFLGRYRFRLRQKDGDDNCPHYYRQHKARMQLKYSPHNALSFVSMADFSLFDYYGSNPKYGFSLSEQMSYSYSKGRADLALTIFRTDDYETRLSIVEPGLYYSFSSAMCYYHGARLSARGEFRLSSKFDAVVRVVGVRYFNRESIGSGLEKIDGSARADMQLQLRYRF